MIKSLTKRQQEFLAKSAQGMTYEEIAEECFVKSRSVANCISQARDRLEVRTTLQCFCVAVAREELGIDHDGRCFVPREDL